MKRLFVLTLLFLVACRSEVDRQMAECREQFPAYAEQITDINDRWADALQVAASTSRISLSGPVGELQSIRREANNIDAPACIAEAHEGYVEGMDTFISFFLDFMSDADSSPDDTDINIAQTKMLALALAVARFDEDPSAFFAETRESLE